MSSSCCRRERHLAKPQSADASETETYICRPLHICFRKHSRAKIQKIRNLSIFVKLFLFPVHTYPDSKISGYASTDGA